VARDVRAGDRRTTDRVDVCLGGLHADAAKLNGDTSLSAFDLVIVEFRIEVGLGGLGQGVCDGLVPVHVGAAGAELARAPCPELP
jgi:hypothetical protein